MKNRLLFFSWVLAAALTFYANGQTTEQIKNIRSQYDLGVLLQLENEFLQKAASEKERVKELAGKLNIPLVIEENGTYRELQKILPDGSLIYYTTFNVEAARSTRTNHLNAGGSLGLNLMGQNMTAHVWDGGLARTTHQEYDGAGGTDRFSIGDGTSTLNYHSAHVTGTIIASGVVAQAKGMAPHARAIGYEWNNDLSEATSAAANGMLISNHSYGYRSDTAPDYYFGAYITDSGDWDNLLFNAPYYLMVVAAGNDGDTNYNGAPLDGNAAYDKLTGHATSKNNLVVANAQDANIDSNGNLISVTINSSSSEGPTDDYRIKPDISGNGTGVYSTYENSNTAYASITGTSMASPNVAGTLLLLQQHYNNLNGNFMRASTLKGLALHTADDAGPNGPDAVYGWGLLNAKKAAETISAKDNGSMIEELTLTQGQSLVLQVDSDGINELRASISWTDRPGTATTDLNNTTARLVNDLDLRITQGTNTYLPWRLTGVTTNGKGDNFRDPFERVEVPGASGTYTVTITHKGMLTGGSQNYSLIITGITSTSCDTAVTEVSGGETCGEGSVELSATGNGDTEELRLYTSSLGGSPIDTITGNSGTFTTPVLTQTTTYYVGAYGGGCESPRVAVTATYLPPPTPLVLTRTDSPVGGGECDLEYAQLSVAGGIETSDAYKEDFGGAISWGFAPPAGNTNLDAGISGTANAGGSVPELVMIWNGGGNYTGNWYLYPVNASNQILPIDISGFNDMVFQFKYMLDIYPPASGNKDIYLEISTNGTTFTPIWFQTGNTVDIPATSVSLDLTSYISSGTVYFRFRYNGNSYGLDGWYIDDIQIGGNIQNDIIWTPTTGLFTDAALTTPYTGGHAPLVYAAPDGTVNYTASAGSFFNSCVMNVSEEVYRNTATFIASTGNWDTPANWDSNAVPDISKCVKIPNGSSLTVNLNDAEAKTIQVDAGGSIRITSGNALTLADNLINQGNAGDFLVESDANLVQLSNTASNSGEIRVEKFFTFTDTGENDRKQYNFVISPTQGQSIKTIYPGNPTVLQYNESTNYFSNSNGAYIAGKGFAVKEPNKTIVPDPTVIAEFEGIPFNGMLDYPLQYTTTHPDTSHGYNLVGNPYPSNLDIQKLYAANQTKIDPNFYFWDNRGNTQFTQQGSNYNGDHYAYFNAVAGGGTGNAAPGAVGDLRIPTKDAKVGTAFMVQALESANGQMLHFENEFRTSNSGPGFFGKNNDNVIRTDRYWLTLTTPTDLSIMQAVVYFTEGENGFGLDDSPSMGGSDDFYSVLDTLQLKIQGKAPFHISDVVPLGMRGFHLGEYQISVYAGEGIFESQQPIYLIDKELNKIHNLSQSPYHFISEAGEFNSRFKIVYSPLSTSQQNGHNKIEINKQMDKIAVHSSLEKMVDIEIYDLRNQLLFSKTNWNQKEILLPINTFSKQILIFKIKTEAGNTTTQKYVNR